MRTALTLSSLGTVVLLLATITACSDVVVPCTDTATCTYAGTTPGDGGAVVPSDCDLTKSLADSPSCVSDGVGIFVSPAGDDNGAGGKGAPVKTVAKGLALAASRGLLRVYVCDGTYSENVEITTAVGLIGGLSCTWAPGAAKPRIAPAKGIGLKVTKVAGNVIVQDVEIDGQADKNVLGDSANASFVSESSSVTFRKRSPERE